MMMSEEQLTTMFKCLAGLKDRPAMYIGDHDPKKALIFLAGFTTALAVCSGFVDHRGEVKQRIIKSRGWNWTNTGLIPQMKERGMSPEDMIAELVSVEIEMIKQITAIKLDSTLEGNTPNERS
ncbi:MAG: hypothetical protein M3N91_04535 [Pseudomonadota bacterium]|nr:hypothetical protein [Pseudomonadota bacterium]